MILEAAMGNLPAWTVLPSASRAVLAVIEREIGQQGTAAIAKRDFVAAGIGPGQVVPALKRLSQVGFVEVERGTFGPRYRARRSASTTSGGAARRRLPFGHPGFRLAGGAGVAGGGAVAASGLAIGAGFVASSSPAGAPFWTSSSTSAARRESGRQASKVRNAAGTTGSASVR
jgi:hypothetical protein